VRLFVIRRELFQRVFNHFPVIALEQLAIGLSPKEHAPLVVLVRGNGFQAAIDDFTSIFLPFAIRVFVVSGPNFVLHGFPPASTQTRRLLAFPPSVGMSIRGEPALVKRCPANFSERLVSKKVRQETTGRWPLH